MDSLYEGYLFNNTGAMRHRWTKWQCSIREYPYDRIPPYISAGAYILSNQLVKSFAIAAPFVKFIKYDDVFVGILALKFGIQPQHNSNFTVFHSYSPWDNSIKYMAFHTFNNIQTASIMWNDLLSYMIEKNDISNELFNPLEIEDAHT